MGPDLFKRVERYEAAVDEMRASHQDIRDVLAEHVLYEKWKQMGADLGFGSMPLIERRPQQQQQNNRDLVSVPDIQKLNDAWEN